MASLASDTLEVERGVQQRSVNIEQRQNKKIVAICFAVAAISVMSAMVGYYAAVHSVGSANTHPGHGIDHTTAFKLERAIAKAFHVTAPTLVRPGQQAVAGSRISGVYPRTAGRANIKMLPEKVAYVMEKFKVTSRIEQAKIIEQIAETFGFDESEVSGAAMMAPSAAVGGGGAAAPAPEEKTEFDVTLESFPADKKIPVIKVVRQVTSLGMMEAKKFVESAPQALKEGIPKGEAEDVKKQLEEVGAVVTIK